MYASQSILTKIIKTVVTRYRILRPKFAPNSISAGAARPIPRWGTDHLAGGEKPHPAVDPSGLEPWALWTSTLLFSHIFFPNLGISVQHVYRLMMILGISRVFLVNSFRVSENVVQNLSKSVSRPRPICKSCCKKFNGMFYGA